MQFSLAFATVPTRLQKVAVMLAFLTGTLSLVAVGIQVVRDGTVDTTPLFGGLFMLALAIGGCVRLRSRRVNERP